MKLKALLFLISFITNIFCMEPLNNEIVPYEKNNFNKKIPPKQFSAYCFISNCSRVFTAPNKETLARLLIIHGNSKKHSPHSKGNEYKSYAKDYKKGQQFPCPFGCNKKFSSDSPAQLAAALRAHKLMFKAHNKDYFKCIMRYIDYQTGGNDKFLD